jgi:hypothetical protein
LPAEPGTLKATLPDTPGIVTRTARVSDIPSIVKKDSYTLLHSMEC